MKFTIQRNGQITDIEVGQSSGNPVLDIAAQRALITTRTLAPLPGGYSGQQLGVQLDFRILQIRVNHEEHRSHLLCRGVRAGRAWRCSERRLLPHRSNRRRSTEFEIKTTIRGEPGAPPHYAVPDFIALTNDKETVEAAKFIASGLWDDLSFEREFDMIPRDTYKTIEQTPTADTIAFDRWRELGADGVIKGSVRAHGQHVAGRDAAVQRAGARRRARPGLRQRGAQKPALRRTYDLG